MNKMPNNLVFSAILGLCVLVLAFMMGSVFDNANPMNQPEQSNDLDSQIELLSALFWSDQAPNVIGMGIPQTQEGRFFIILDGPVTSEAMDLVLSFTRIPAERANFAQFSHESAVGADIIRPVCPLTP